MELSPVLSVLGMLRLRDLAHLHAVIWITGRSQCQHLFCNYRNPKSLFHSVTSTEVKLVTSNGELCSWVAVVSCWLRLSFKFAAAGEPGLSGEPLNCAALCLIAVTNQPFSGALWWAASACERTDTHQHDQACTEPILHSRQALISPTDAATIFLSDAPILSYHLWSPATRFLGGRHGNLKLPLGNRGSVRHENDFKESRKQRFGAQCGPAPAKHRPTLLCSFCVEF